MFRWRRVHTSRSKITPTDAPSKSSGAGIGSLPSAIAEKDDCCFSALPQQLLEAILKIFKDDMGRGNTKDMFCAIGVCKSWRAAGHALFFKDSWGSGAQTPSGPAIQHPAQLITLCPLQRSPGGHIKCYMQRELVSSGLSGKVYRYVLSQGIDYGKANGKFLLAAVQEGKQCYNIFLNRSCTGKPIAKVSANMMRTAYTLLTAAGSGSSSNTCSRRSSSSSGDLKKKQVAGEAEQQLGHDGPLQQQRQQQMVWCGCALCSSSAGGAAAAAVPQELARVAYKLRVRGIMLPRRMSVSIPAPQQQQQVQHKLQQLTAAASPQQRNTGYRQEQMLIAAAAAAAAEIQDDTAAQSDQNVPTAAVLAASGFSRSCSAQLQQQIQGLDLHAATDRARCFSDGALPRGPWQQQQQQPDLVQQQQLLLQHSPSFRTALQLQLLLQQCQRAQHCPLHFLHNKQPHWNEALRCWCLNFRGRVRLASVKNFQLVTDTNPRSAAPAISSLAAAAAAAAAGPDGSDASFSSDGASSTSDASSSSSDSHHPASVAAAAAGGGYQAGVPEGGPEAAQAGLSGLTAGLSTQQGLLLRGSAHTGGIVTQFGKVDSDMYILDYDPVLINGLQAFAVALTSFGTKVLL